jgi:hypothetical protein
MGDLQPNFFEEPLVNTTVGYGNDGVDPTEIINLVFKKNFGIPNAKPYTQYYEDLFTTNSFIQTFQNQQYSQFVPSAPPTDLIKDTTFTPLYPDISGVYPDISGVYPDISGVSYTQERFFSAQYPYLAYYSKNVTSNTNPDYDYSFYIESDGYMLTRNAIPMFYGLNKSNFELETTYFNQTQLYTIDGSEQVLFGTPGFGQWLFDTDSGIITFYDTPPYGIGPNSPPLISFWRYEGLIGNSGINTIVDY